MEDIFDEYYVQDLSNYFRSGFAMKLLAQTLILYLNDDLLGIETFAFTTPFLTLIGIFQKLKFKNITMRIVIKKINTHFTIPLMS